MPTATRTTYRPALAARPLPQLWLPPISARTTFIPPTILPADCPSEETP